MQLHVQTSNKSSNVNAKSAIKSLMSLPCSQDIPYHKIFTVTPLLRSKYIHFPSPRSSSSKPFRFTTGVAIRFIDANDNYLEGTW